MKKKSFALALVLVVFASALVAAAKPTATNGVQLLIQNNQTYSFYYHEQEFATAQLLNKLTPGGPEGKPYIECQSEVWCAVDLRVEIKTADFPGQDGKWFKGRFLKDLRGKSWFESFLVKRTATRNYDKTAVTYRTQTIYNTTTNRYEDVTVEQKTTERITEDFVYYSAFQPSDLQVGKTLDVRFVFYRPWGSKLESDLSFNLFGFDFDFLAWWNTAWHTKLEYYQVLTLGEDAGETVLPVNFSTTTLVGRQVLSADLNASRFINGSEDTSKDYYIENVTNNTGNTVYWVKEPYVNNGNNTGYFYYNDNATTTDVEADPYGSDTGLQVWLDMSDRTPDPVNRFRTDSNLSCGTSPGVVSGVYGNASNWTSAAYTCTQGLALSTYITGNNTWTIEYVIKRNADFAVGAYAAGAYDVGGGYISFLGGGGAANTTWLEYDTYDSADQRLYIEFPDFNWHHIVLKSYGSTTPYTKEIWKDGVLEGTQTYNGLGSTAGTVRFFGHFTGSQRVSIDSLYWSNANKSNAWIIARYNALVKNAWTFGGEQQLTESISISPPTPSNQSILNVTYAYLNATGQTTGGPNSYCFVQIYNSSGLYAKNISTSVSGTYFDCFINQTNAIGNQTFNITIVGGSNATSSQQNYNLPQYRIRTFSEDDGSFIAASLVVSNSTTSGTFNSTAGTYWLHYEVTQPTSLTASATGFESRTYTLTPSSNFTTYDAYLPPTSGSQNILIIVFSGTYGVPVSGATVVVQKLLNGSYVVVANQTTDGAGQAAFTLMTGDSYLITASASGYETTTQSITINAIQSSYYIYFGAGTGIVNFTTPLNGISYWFNPISSRINTNGTNVTFNVSAEYTASMNFSCVWVYDADGNFLFYQNQTHNSTNLTAQYNFPFDVYAHTRNVTAYGCIQRSNPYVYLNVTTFWYVGNFTNTTSSLYGAIQTIRAAGTNSATFAFFFIIIAAIITAWVTRLSVNVESGGVIAIILMAIGTFVFNVINPGAFVLTAVLGLAVMFLKWRGVF